MCYDGKSKTRVSKALVAAELETWKLLFDVLVVA